MTTNKSIVEIYQENITRSTQQAFIHAVQQSNAYRNELTAYQAEHPAETVLDEDSTAMIEAIDNVLSACSNFISLVAPPTVIELPVQVPVVATQQKTAPTQEELIRLYRKRDDAFFAYMNCLNPIKKRDALDAFERDDTKVLAVDEITRPYCFEQYRLLREWELVSKKINDPDRAQRTWLDFIIENALPSFVLKAMKYMNSQALTQKKIEALKKKLDVINEKLTTLQTQFHENWEKIYPKIPRQNSLDKADSTLVTKIVNLIRHEELSNVYDRYHWNKTVSNLLDFYRLVHQLRLQAIQSDNKEIVADQLAAIAEKIELLHPDRLDNFATEKACVEQELELFEQYLVLPNINQMTEKTDPFTKFMVHMKDKYATFLKARTLGHFSDLFQHIHSDPQYRFKKMVQDTRALLKSLYPQAYEHLSEQQFTHIDEQAYEAFLKKYETLKLDHPIYVSLIGFMRDPTHEKWDAMQQKMIGTNDNAHYLDHRLNAAIAEFMTICSTISGEDCNSDAYSEGSDMQADTAERRPSMDALKRSVPTDDVETQTPSVQNLIAQNEQFSAQFHLATSKHSLFAVPLNPTTHTESKQMLEEIWPNERTT